MMAENDKEVDTTTFENVEQTAKEFGRIALHLPKHQMVSVMDDTLWGDGWIKQCEDTPDGLRQARRWAVRLDDTDEVRNEPFETLRSASLQAIDARNARPDLVTEKEQAKFLHQESYPRP